MRPRIIGKLSASAIALGLVVICAGPSEQAAAASPFLFGGHFAVLQNGVPDPRVTNDPDYSAADDDLHSWEAHDIEPYGTAAVAELDVVGSSFIRSGTIDIGVTPQGVVLGEIYMDDGDWVAHLEGLLLPDGVSGYVLAANGEIDQIYLSAPHLAALLAAALERAWGSPTPTPAESNTPTSTPVLSPTPTETSATPSATPTPVNTKTPVPTATATDTPGEGCEFYTFSTSSEYFALSEGAAAEAVAPLWCSNNYPMLPVVNVTDDVTGVVFQSHTLLRWDTSSISEDLVPTAAWLRAIPVSTGFAATLDPDERSLYGEWFDAGVSVCGTGDFDSGDGTALSIDAECDRQCDLSTVIPDMQNDFPLSGVAEHIGATAAIRLWVPNGGTNAANHLLLLASGDILPGPQLIVLACTRPPDPTPTPTPPFALTPLSNGCALGVIEGNGMAEVAGTDTSYPLSYDSCTNPGDTVEASVDSGTFTRRALLLSWDTNFNDLFSPDTPAGSFDGVLSEAWVRLHVTETWNDDETLSLSGDWHQWSCDESDYTGTNAADALSTGDVCGSACAVSAFEADQDVDLPLTDPDAHVRLFGYTQVRVEVSGTPAAGRNGLTVADGSDEEHHAPQLVIEVCPHPQPTPEPGCHYDTFTPDANGATAWASGSTYPPAFDHCESDIAGRVAGASYVDLPFLDMEGWLGAKSAEPPQAVGSVSSSVAGYPEMLKATSPVWRCPPKVFRTR